MAEIVTDPDIFIPVELFKFRKAQLDAWCNGQVHLLVANKDFPRAMTFDQVKARMKAAARYRDCRLELWPDGAGNLYLIFGPPGPDGYSR